MPKTISFQKNSLIDYVVRFFTALQVPEEDARIAADVLVSADLRGIHSHGVIRLNSYYGDRLQNRRINPNTPVKTIQEQASSLVLDGGNGLGPVVAFKAMSQCIAKAKTAGLAITTVRNSNHFGIAGYYAMMALPEDMIGISLTNSQPLVAPTYGREPALGTNPIALAAPAGKERPYVLDMATSIVSIGKIVVHEKTGQPIPEGWGINQAGEITTDPAGVHHGGSLLPLGGLAEMRGYKGYGLSMMVDLLAGILSGAAYGKKVGNPAESGMANVGHFFASIKIENFRPLDEFKTNMDDYINSLKAEQKIPGEDKIYIPGEKEYVLMEKYQAEGIPLAVEIVDSLKQAGDAIKIPFDLQPA